MTLKARMIVRFKGLKKSRIAVSILDFLSPLKQTIIRTFLVSLVFINGIIECCTYDVNSSVNILYTSHKILFSISLQGISIVRLGR